MGLIPFLTTILLIVNHAMAVAFLPDSITCSNSIECSGIDSYQHVVVEGLPYTRGKSHGSQAKDKILISLEQYKTSPSMPAWKDCLEFVEKNYMRALEKYFPAGLEEMRGIAEGANLTVQDIIILNARYDLTKWKRSQVILKAKLSKKFTEIENNELNGKIEGDEECTGAVALKSATKNQEVLLGQNWDNSELILNNDTAILLEVRPDPSEKIKPFVMLTEAGQMGRSGMNADGLGVIAMSLWSSNEIYERKPGDKYPDGWVPVTLLRRMFLGAPTFPLGLRAILTTPRHVSVNMIVATGEDEALNIELTPEDYFVTQVPIDKEILTHSNHFKSQSFTSRDEIKEGSRGSSSLFRDRRVEKYLQGAWPSIESTTFQEAFKDHVGHPNSVCEHSVPKDLAWTSAHPSDTTVASIIYNLSKRTLELCKGPPCQGTFKKYIFHFSLVVPKDVLGPGNTTN